MIITHVNSGQKAIISVDDTVITINDELTIDVSQHQTDTQVVLDVCLDNKLETMQIGLGAWYVANIIVPSRQYDLIDDEQVVRKIDMSQVECRLWALPLKTMIAEQDKEGMDV